MYAHFHSISILNTIQDVCTFPFLKTVWDLAALNTLQCPWEQVLSRRVVYWYHGVNTMAPLDLLHCINLIHQSISFKAYIFKCTVFEEQFVKTLIIFSLLLFRDLWGISARCNWQRCVSNNRWHGFYQPDISGDVPEALVGVNKI